MANTDVSKSWFCVFNNPENHGFNGTPEEIVEKIIEIWLNENPQRTCAVNYCISAEGLNHCHAVFEDTKAMRYTVITKLFYGIHCEPTKGSKEQAEDYFYKRNKWEEKGEKVIYSRIHGEIKGKQGKRNDLEIIEELLQLGKTPNEIMDMNLSFRRYEKIIRDAFYRKRDKETPLARDITVYWHVGESGSGKSYEQILLSQKYDSDYIYKISDWRNGNLDKYSGEPILFIDEFRGDVSYATFLTILDKYKSPLHARYTNIVGLWTEVHITSVFSPEALYNEMITSSRQIDSYEQLRRRITYVVYHYKKGDVFKKMEIPIESYKNYEQLKYLAESESEEVSECNKPYVQCEISETSPFE